jgi:hypothetical protein
MAVLAKEMAYIIRNVSEIHSLKRLKSELVCILTEHYTADEYGQTTGVGRAPPILTSALSFIPLSLWFLNFCQLKTT